VSCVYWCACTPSRLLRPDVFTTMNVETLSLTIFSLSFLTPVYSVYSLVLTTGTVVERSLRIRYKTRILTTALVTTWQAYLFSTTSIRRHGLLLAKYIQNKTMENMAKAASISVMFDEAADIQMHKHLNIFVNVSTSTKFL
jgi:hypothetical protein